MPGDERKMALFSQYAMAAAGEALEDAGWKPSKEEDFEATVTIFCRCFVTLRLICVSGSLHWIWNRQS